MKTILITGAANGLGKELVAGFAAAGHEVIGLDRTDLPGNPGTSRYIRCDLRDHAGSRLAIQEIFAGGRQVDVLINNAAIGTVAPLEYEDAEGIADTISVNLIAPLVVTREVLPYMRKRRSGRIVNISSLASTASVPGTSVYAGSKAGLERSSRILQAEVRDTGISIGVARIGRMRTESYFRAGRVLRERLTAGAFQSCTSIEDALWVMAGESAGSEPRDVARQVMNFAWTTREHVTIAPFGERVQSSLANQLPPILLNRLLGIAGRMAKPK